MNIHLILITYALDPTPLFKAADGKDITWNCFMHSRNQAVWDAVIDFEAKGRFEMYDYGVNRGLAKSWNEGIIAAHKFEADVTLIINDDVIATHDDILTLAQTTLDHPECGIVTAWGFNERMGDVRDNGYSLFGINPIAIERVGYFDQNFYPLYFEDSDYTKRLALTNTAFHSCTETNIFHKGSASIGTVAELNRQNNHTFQANNAYFVRKWGGQPSHETFIRPFGDSRFGLKITAEERHAPYPEYNRTDQDIVKI